MHKLQCALGIMGVGNAIESLTPSAYPQAILGILEQGVSRILLVEMGHFVEASVTRIVTEESFVPGTYPHIAFAVFEQGCH